MIFRSTFDLRDYAQRFINLGLGHARPMLDRRGYTRRVALIDAIFGKDHCKHSYMSEKNGAQNAPEYRQ